MIISNYQVQSTLRAYGQQMADRTRLAKVKAPANTGPKDEVVFSQESKKRLTAEKIAHQIIQQFSAGKELSSTHRQILSQLSREFGQPVKVEKKEDQNLKFKVADGKSSDEARPATREESEELSGKLLEITRSIVYNNLG